MSLDQLQKNAVVRDVKTLLSGVEHSVYGNISDMCINRIEYDSRHVTSGDMFVCVRGTFQDGHKYAHAAVDKGAVVLVVEEKLGLDVPQIIVPNSRIAMAQIAAAYYGNPAKDLRIVGITGTNGKTTTTYMLKAIGESAGLKIGLIGTIKNMIGSKVVPADRTTPESVELQELLALMRDSGVDLVIMEVSSHSLDQHRVYGLHFEVAEFTNLTQDHLDYHKTFDNYIECKKMLFSMCDKAVINIDDQYAEEIKREINYPVVTFGISNNADIYAKGIDINPQGVSFSMHRGKESTPLHVPIPGLFNVYNALGSAAVAEELGIDRESIKNGLYNMLSVSGRLEPLNTYGRDFSVLLDYAHAPDAMENILKTVRGFARGRIVTLFGCGGDRDKAKRPIMGEIAGRLSDFLIVTSDNPRSENPSAIINMIMEGVRKSGSEHIIIENRLEAIKYALANAKKDDVIILAGKGHENYQEINGIKHHFDEKEIVDELLRS